MVSCHLSPGLPGPRPACDGERRRCGRFLPLRLHVMNSHHHARDHQIQHDDRNDDLSFETAPARGFDDVDMPASLDVPEDTAAL